MLLFQPILGLTLFLLLFVLISENRKLISIRFVAWSLGFQFLLAALLLNAPIFNHALHAVAGFFNTIGDATKAGTSFVFGYLGGANAPFEIKSPENSFIFAFQVLPSCIVIAALSGVLWHWGVLPWLINKLAWVFRSTMRLSGPVAFSSTANIFFAMTEAIAMIYPTVAKMTRSQMLQMMTVGMTTVAGSVFLVYAQFMEKLIPNAMEHIITASIIHLPAGLLFAHLLVPPESAETKGEEYKHQPTESNAFEAFLAGASRAIPIIVSCIVMLIAIMATLSLIDKALLAFSNGIGLATPLSLGSLFGMIFAPLAWLIGIPWKEAIIGGELIGLKTIVNEFVALIKLSTLSAEELSPTSAIIISYCLVSFANFVTVGCIVGAVSALAPDRKREAAELGMKSMLTGLFATLTTGAVIAILNQFGLAGG